MKERFESKVLPVTESGCWIWMGSVNERGYGYFYTPADYSNSQMDFAHRVSVFLYHGVKPSRSDIVCHKCDNPSCVNPAHLFVADQTINMKDMVAKGRHRTGREKLEPEDVMSILDSTDSVRSIAEEYGLNYGYISKLKNGKVKKWLSLYNEWSEGG